MSALQYFASQSINSWESRTSNYLGKKLRYWAAYLCANCGDIVTAYTIEERGEVREIFPSAFEVDDAIPSPAKEFLSQAIGSLHAPSGSIMLSASSVDAMLKLKNYKNGSLYSRIDKAAADNLITGDMALWAHEIRFDANEQRHADDKVLLPDEEDAKRCIDFVKALGEFIFVLPSKVKHGIKAAIQPEEGGSLKI
jgi:hypothetical protein